MEIKSYSKLDIAVNQIQTAIEIYLNDQDPFSVITLAGAGEEILARLLQRHSKEPTLMKHAEALKAIHEELNGKSPDLKHVRDSLNEAKNTIRHMNCSENGNVTMDPIFEAEAMLNRAIDNYYALTGRFTDKMQMCFGKLWTRYTLSL